jgi:hypothetical protein
MIGQYDPASALRLRHHERSRKIQRRYPEVYDGIPRLRSENATLFDRLTL